MMLRLFIFLALALFLRCSTNENLGEQEDPRDTILTNSSLRKIHKLVTLDHGFFVQFSDAQKYGSSTLYGYMRLSRNTGAVFTDSVHRYQLEDHHFPLVIAKTEDRYEILMEISNAPEKNYLHWIFVEGDKLMNTSVLPMFVTGKADVNRDGIYEFAGFTHHTEPLIRDGHRFTAYNPLLFYSVTPNGLRLDRALTRERNKIIYGEFLGYAYDENIEVKAGTMEKFDEEIRRIKKLAETGK